LTLQNFIPHPALREFVACIFTVENRMDNKETCVYSPYPPTPQNSIIFYVRDVTEIERPDRDKLIKLPPCIFTGQHTERINTKSGKNHLMVYVGFKPGGMYRLLGIPMNKFINDEIDGMDLYGYEISEILERLNVASGCKELVTIVESFLISKLKKLKPEDPFDFAIQEIIKRNGNIGMDEVAALSCLSFRQFERKCMEKIGIAPKLYARITRFSKAYRMKEMNPTLKWTGIAHANGYYDQMHMIRDFKEFTGVTPSGMDNALSEASYKLQTNLMI
jgi:AraC-like DNA-binding protein